MTKTVTNELKITNELIKVGKIDKAALAIIVSNNIGIMVRGC